MYGGPRGCVYKMAVSTQLGWSKRRCRRSFSKECPTRTVFSSMIFRRSCWTSSSVVVTPSIIAAVIPEKRVLKSKMGRGGCTRLSYTVLECSSTTITCVSSRPRSVRHISQSIPRMP